MLEQLFGSKTRTKLLHLFLENPEKLFFVREITREIDERINSVRRELDNLENFGLIKFKNDNQKKYYQVDTSFVLYKELKVLIDKSILLAEKFVMAKAKKFDALKYMALCGELVGDTQAQIDLLLVGKITDEALNKFIRELENLYRLQIRYTLFSTKEFNLRKSMTDKFLYNILNGPKTVLIDRISGLNQL